MSRKPDAPPGYVVLGRLGMAHGVKGWLKLHSFTDPEENILEYRRFTVFEDGQPRELEIDESRPQGKTFIAHVKGCDDRELVRHYTGRELLIAKDALPPLQEGDYYWHQLVGLRVVNGRGELLGVVERLMETGANDVLVLRGAESGETQSPAEPGERKPASPQGEVLVPYVVGRVIRRVDLDAGLIEVDWEVDY